MSAFRFNFSVRTTLPRTVLVWRSIKAQRLLIVPAQEGSLRFNHRLVDTVD